MSRTPLPPLPTAAIESRLFTADQMRAYAQQAAYEAGVEWATQAAPTPAARDVLAERHRQIRAEGWTPEHDDEHADGGMAKAAAAYAWASRGRAYHQFDEPAPAPALWPWGLEWWKPGDPRRMLVKAGALILAELERLDRAVPDAKEQP